MGRITKEEEKQFARDIIYEEGVRCVEKIAKCQALELEGPLELMYTGMAAMVSSILNKDYESIIQFCDHTTNVANDIMLREMSQEKREEFQKIAQKEWDHVQKAVHLALDVFEKLDSALDN